MHTRALVSSLTIHVVYSVHFGFSRPFDTAAPSVANSFHSEMAVGAENVQLFPGVGILLSFAYVSCLTYGELLVAVTPSLDEVTFMW